MSRLTALALLSLAWVAGCAQEPLPAPYARRGAGPCVDAPPPSVLVLSRPTDPSSCLSASARQRGVSVFIEVDAKGRPIAVEEVHDLCLMVEEDGRPGVGLDLPLQAARTAFNARERGDVMAAECGGGVLGSGI
jgi:hypothetical protein